MEKKEAMKILKDFHDKSALFSVRTALDIVIPELAESEDERVRKELLNLFKIENFNGYVTLNGIDVDDVIAWLEKKREKSVIVDVDKIVSKYANTKEACTNGLPVNCQIRAYRQGINDALRLSLNLEKQGEQNPAWSEGDDAYKIFAISAVEDYYDEKNPLRKDIVDWLKSLKQRIGG